MIKITAHRGYSEKYPENTLLAFKKALEIKADRIEFDVQQTRDGNLVIHHGYFLGKTDNGEGILYEKDLSYLQSLDAGGWFDSQFVDEKIITLDELFEELRSKTYYELELKGFGKTFVQHVVAMVKHYGLLDRVEFTSTYPYLARQVKEVEPLAKIGYIFPKPPDWITPELMKKIYLSESILGNIDVMHCSIRMVDKKFVDEVHKLNKLVHAADCDTEEDIKKAIEISADQLSTNTLELAITIKEMIQ